MGIDSQSFSNFLKEVVRFEKKKLILPTLMVLILLGSVLYGLHLRDSQKVDERITNNSVSQMKGITLIFLEARNFPEESGIVNKSVQRQRKEKLREKYEDPYSPSEKKIFKIGLSPAIIALGTDIYPFTPAATMIRREAQGPLPADGQESSFYFWGEIDSPPLVSIGSGKKLLVTKELTISMAEIFYIQKEFGKLDEEINQTNMSYDEFESKVEEIKSEAYSHEAFKDELRELDLKEVQFIHFVPSFIASFLLYYLLSGVVVAGYRSSINEAESLLNSEELDHSIASSATGFAFLAGLLMLGITSLIPGFKLTYLGLFVIMHAMVGIGFYFLSGHLTSGHRWLNRSVMLYLIAFSLFVVYEAVFDPFSTELYLLAPVIADIALVGLTCWRIEKNIKEDFRQNRIRN